MGEATLLASDTSTAPQTRPPTHTPKYKRLTQAQLVVLFDLHKLNKTQVEIAQALGCDQASVCRALQQFTDTSASAIAFLRAAALPMAQNIVKKGRAADHIKALEGIEVLSNQDVKGGLTIVVGGSAQVQVNVGTRLADVTLSPLSAGAQSETT
jgi:hypothetical protein